MFQSPKKKPAAGAAGMDRREISLWLGRALSSDQVVLQAVIQLVHVVGVQQQAIQALARQQSGRLLEVEQAETLEKMESQAGADILERLAELEAGLAPVLEAVEQACAVLEKDIR